MKIIINSLSAGSGGGIAVAVAYAKFLSQASLIHETSIVLAPNAPAHMEIAERLSDCQCQIVWASRHQIHPAARTATEGFLLRSLIKKQVGSGGMVLVQLNGLLPLWPACPAKTVLLIQDPSAYVSSTYGNSRSRIGSFIRRKVQRYSLQKADAALYTSHFIKDLVSRSHPILPGINKVVYNGFEKQSAARQIRHKNPSDDRFRIITVSNVSQYKGQGDVIKAIGLAVRSHAFQKNGIMYDIVGDIPSHERKRLNTSITHEGLADSVRIHGRLPDSLRDELVHNADLFVHLSRCESFGIPIIEAMSQGVPVLAARRTALPEVGGRAAEYCNPDDLSDVSASIIRLAQTPRRRAEMVELGFKNAERFSWSNVAASVCSVISSLDSRFESPS